jgi:hypothetical protein
VLRRVRLDQVLVDLVLTVVFTAIAEVEVWLTTEVHHHRVAGALLAPPFTVSIAIRRRYPTPSSSRPTSARSPARTRRSRGPSPSPSSASS